jgi:hypothetical protein
MRNDDGFECGNKTHSISARIRPSTGANIYGDIFAGVGLACSFVNNLMASAKG